MTRSKYHRWTNAQVATLRDQITAFLAGREEATLKQIAAATTERDFPRRVTAELNRMRTDAVVECEKKKGKNELWYWLAAPARAVQDSQPAVEQNTGSSVAGASATQPAGAAVHPKPAPAAAASPSAAPVAADENDDRTDKDSLSVPPPEYDQRSVAFDPKTRLTAASDENYSLLGVLADIRAAVGDPDGRLMQDELVERIRTVAKAAAVAKADLLNAGIELEQVRALLLPLIYVGDPENAPDTLTTAQRVASEAARQLELNRDNLNMIACASETLAEVVRSDIDTSDMDLAELAKAAAAQLTVMEAEIAEWKACGTRFLFASPRDMQYALQSRDAQLRNANALTEKLEHLLQSARNEAEHLRTHTGTAEAVAYAVVPAYRNGEITDYAFDHTLVAPAGAGALDEAKRLAAQEVDDGACETAKICALIPVATAARRVVFEPA